MATTAKGTIQQLHHDGSSSSTNNAVIIANNASSLTAAIKHMYNYKKRKYSLELKPENGSNKKGQGLLMMSFPWKLHSLLERNEQEQRRRHQEQDENDSKLIFGWLSDGKGFAIHDQKRFVHEIMPSYFYFDGSSRSNRSRIQSFQTFQQNLELWGFTTSIIASSNVDENTVSTTIDNEDEDNNIAIYSHPLFLKGYPDICMNMKFGVP